MVILAARLHNRCTTMKPVPHPPTLSVRHGPRRPLLSLAFGLLALCIIPTAHGQEDPPADSPLEAIREARERLRQQEAQSGPYDTALVEPLANLAELQISAGRVRAAEELLNRQQEIQRVNLGLHSASQIPVLESLLRLQIRRNDLDEARNTIGHLVWIHSRTDDINAGEQLTGLQRTRAWLMLLLQRDRSDEEAGHLLMYRQISERMRQLADTRYTENDPDRLPWLYESAKADLVTALTIVQNPMTGQELIEELEGITPRYGRMPATITSASDLEMVYGARAGSAMDRTFRKYMRSHAATIDEMLTIAEATEDDEAVAMLALYRGDSVLLRQQYERRTGRLAGPRRGRGSMGTAAGRYRKAVEKLKAVGHGDSLIIERLGCPALLPLADLHLSLEQYPACPKPDQSGTRRMQAGETLLGSRLPGFSFDPESSLPDTGTDATSRAVIALEIGVNGQASHSDVIHTGPENGRHRAEVRHLVADLQFRPALDASGEAVRSHKLQLVVTLPGED